MAEESALQKSVSRAARAKALLGDDLLIEAFGELSRRYVEEWQATSARDQDARERLWTAVNVLGKVREHLSRVVADGSLAQRELDDLEGRSKLEQMRRKFSVV